MSKHLELLIPWRRYKELERLARSNRGWPTNRTWNGSMNRVLYFFPQDEDVKHFDREAGELLATED